MPINIPIDLPAFRALSDENIFVMAEDRAQSQDVRPLQIAIVNLMPTKIATEIQLLRLLSNSPIQVDITLIRAENHVSRNTSPAHLERFYTGHSKLQNRKFDGMIITGAPVEQMPFGEVDYWDELCAIMEYSKENVFSTLHICWGAQAGLHYHYGVPKQPLPEKMFGVFPHRLASHTVPLFRGFDDEFFMPHSRHTEVRYEDLQGIPGLRVLACSQEAGVCIVGAEESRQFFVTGHFEYDANTLALEYQRDVGKGLPIGVPANYYPDDDPAQPPLVRWRSHASLFFSNWLNYYVYQATPFELDNIGACSLPDPK